MLASSLLRNALTPDEQRLMPKFLVDKLDEEMALYEETVGERARELERKVGVCEDIINELNVKLARQEVEMKEMRVSSGLMGKYNEMNSQEIKSLKSEISYYKEKIREVEMLQGVRCRVGGEGGGGVIGALKTDESAKKKELEKRCLELEKSNKRLVERIIDQKKRMSYLVKKGLDSDGAKDNLELVKLVQKLSRRNDELEKGSVSGSDPLSEEGAHSRFGDAILAEREEYKRMQSELYEVKKNGYVLEVEYNRIFMERRELYNQVIFLSEEKKMLQKCIDEMREEVMCLKIDLGNIKAKNMLLGDASQKLVEMNNEIVRSNLVMKEDRNKIRELKMQLAESEERYNKYILEDRTNVVALLGREMESMKRKIESEFKVVHDVEADLKAAWEEYGKLKELVRLYESEVFELKRREKISGEKEKRMGVKMRGYADGIRRYEEFLRGLRLETSSVYEYIETMKADFVELFGVVDGVVAFEGGRRMFIGGLSQELDRVNDLLGEKDMALYSLIENRSEDAVGLLGRERNILKQENVFLRNKMENLGDSSDLMEKINRLEEENEMIRTRFGALERSYVSSKQTQSGQAAALDDANQRSRQLQLSVDEMFQSNAMLRNELEVVRRELSEGYDVIGKYKLIVQKLKKIKEAYLQLLGEEGLGKSGGSEQKILNGEEKSQEASHDVLSGENATEDGCVLTETPAEVGEDDDLPGISAADEKSPRGGMEVCEDLSSKPGNRDDSQQGFLNQADRGRGQPPGRSRRGERLGKYGEDSRQGNPRRAYGDRKRSWPAYEFKRSKDRRN